VRRQPAPLGGGRHLTVVVSGQPVALPGEAVREVLRRPRLTRVPHGPPGLAGVCNLRGVVLPVVSLAHLMGEEAGGEDRVVVLDHQGPLGVLVDAVLKLQGEDASGASRRVDLAALLEDGFRRPAAPASVARSQAGARPEAGETRQVERVLVSFLVQGQTFALPLAAVIEILRLPDEIARVPSAGRAVVGMVDIRDRPLPIVSLAALLGFADDAVKRSVGRILVVDKDGARIGLVADGIDAILRLPEAAIDTVPPILQRGGGEAKLDGIGRPGGGRALVSILSVPRLFADVSVAATAAVARRDGTEMDDEGTAGRQEQFVVFDLGGERYGLPIAAVDEVLRLPERVTRVPNGPRFVRGIINLRGRPVPIIDQRERFGAPAADTAARPRVIVVSFGGLQAGFVVDTVSEILTVPSDEIAVAPSFSSDRSEVFDRVARTGEEGGLILLVDPQELLSRAERDALVEIAARQTGAAST
jgi:purine-binding chemotaxis protein CheW